MGSRFASFARQQGHPAYVEQPLSGRKPVGYQQEFLQNYQPGITWYLPLTLRRQLHKMGQTVKASEPAGTYSRDILSRLLIDLSWASSHLECNTYSRLDTRELIENGNAALGKGAIETQMILNHKSAIELLVENIAVVGFDRFTLMNLRSALAENLLPNPTDEGRIRQHAVDIGLSVFRPLSLPAQIEAAFDLMLDKVNQITDPFEQSFFHDGAPAVFATICRHQQTDLTPGSQFALVSCQLVPFDFSGRA